MPFHVGGGATWPRTEEATLMVPHPVPLSTRLGIELAI